METATSKPLSSVPGWPLRAADKQRDHKAMVVTPKGHAAVRGDCMKEGKTIHWLTQKVSVSPGQWARGTPAGNRDVPDDDPSSREPLAAPADLPALGLKSTSQPPSLRGVPAEPWPGSSDQAHLRAGTGHGPPLSVFPHGQPGAQWTPENVSEG